jgi:DNA invertase Pin-like site-specific DNA recombinase
VRGRLRGRQGRRSKIEIEAERQTLRDQTEKEIDELVAEFHRLLPREEAEAIGVAYARYSSEFQHSIVDQVRAIFEAAVNLGIFIPREMVFYDIAVRGCKERRPGLDQVRAVLGRKAAQVLLVFTTNRLFRKSYKCMKFVEEEVVGRGQRCVFVKTGIDTAKDDRWRLPLQMHAMIDDLASTMYAENIRAAHEGLFRKGFVVSTIPFGYTGQDVEGPKTKRGLPRQIIVIDEETADWVRRIFHWFVVDRLPKARILERLNDQAVPCGPKADGTFWSDHALTYLLSNECYRGQWAYGRGKNVWQAAADYAKRVLREKPLCEAYFEQFRIVSDELWYKAQELQATTPQRNAGRKPKDGNTATRPRDMNGLLKCPTHDCPLKVGGTYGQHMFCQKCRNLPKEKRPLYSYLNRALALRLICRALADAIRQNSNFIEALMQPFLAAAASFQTGEVDSLGVLQKKSDKLTVQIDFVQSNPGVTERDQKESKEKLTRLRAERAVVDAEFARLKAFRERAARVPTEADFRAVVDKLDDVLTTAAAGRDPASPGELRRVLELLTGGSIVVEQIGERRACRGWLRARIRLHLVETCADHLDLLPAGPVPAKEILVDIKEPKIAEARVDAVMALYGQGMLVTAIAERLGIDRHQVTDAVRIGHERAGRSVPEDGRVRRAGLAKKGLREPLAWRLADEAKALFDQGLLIEQIAEALGCHRDSVKAALRHWFDRHGLPMPDLRTRRKSLAIKNRPKPKADTGPVETSTEG